MNIVSIDFDIIMEPTIELYNSLVPGKSWEDLYNVEAYKYLICNCDIYEKLTSYVLYLSRILKCNNIYFMHDHGSMYKLFSKNDTNINLINIDHHHDITYNDNERHDQSWDINCANWVKYAYENFDIASYTWIHDNNSEPLSEIDDRFDYITETKNINDIGELSKELPKADKVAICLSEPWLPPDYRGLFCNWLNILNRIYNTHFDFID